MNNFFDPNSRLGSAFNDIFGQVTPAQPQPTTPSTSKAPPTVARMGVARPIDSSKASR